MNKAPTFAVSNDTDKHILNHVNVNTGRAMRVLREGLHLTMLELKSVNARHARRAYRAALDAANLADLSGWLPEVLAGTPRGILQAGGHIYIVRTEYSSSKAALFAVARLDDMLRATDIVHISVCRHSKLARRAWQNVGGTGEPPGRPFIAELLLNEHIVPNDYEIIPVVTDFELYLAYAWLDLTQRQGDEQ